MVDIFKEVEEDLRRHRMQSMWDRFGKYVIGLLVAMVLAVGGYQYWEFHQRNVQAGESAEFSEALAMIENSDRDGGLAALDSLRQSGSTGYRALAALREAETLARMGEIEDAIIIYERLAADSGTNPALRDYGELMAIAHLIDQGDDPDVLAGRLQKLAAPGAPWAHLATELEGILLLEQGRIDAARERFIALAVNEDLSPGLRQRAEALAAVAGGSVPPVDVNEGAGE